MREADELTEAERRFEDALKSLRPAAARIDCAAAASSARRRLARRRRMWQAAAAAVVLAGGVWLALGPRPSAPGNGVQLVTVEGAAGSAATLAEPPTLLAYRRALGRSPAELESLLHQHMIADRPPDKAFPVIGVLAL